MRIQVRASTKKKKVWNEAENRERDWGETLRHALPISLLVLRKKKTTVLQSNIITTYVKQMTSRM